MIGVGLFTVSNDAARRWFYQAGHRVPIVGGLLKAREIATWARLTSFALANGVALLSAAVLSRQAAPPGSFRNGLEAFENDLKAGVAVDVSLGRNTGLTPMDLSLLRAGEKSGALAPMFGFLADSYDDQLKDAMKRMTALIEPLAIGLHGVSAARIQPGDRVLVLGAGSVALCAIYWARRRGAGRIAVLARSARRARSFPVSWLRGETERGGDGTATPRKRRIRSRGSRRRNI